jgi:hypothetical protein
MPDRWQPSRHFPAAHQPNDGLLPVELTKGKSSDLPVTIDGTEFRPPRFLVEQKTKGQCHADCAADSAAAIGLRERAFCWLEGARDHRSNLAAGFRLAARPLPVGRGRTRPGAEGLSTCGSAPGSTAAPSAPEHKDHTDLSSSSSRIFAPSSSNEKGLPIICTPGSRRP